MAFPEKRIGRGSSYFMSGVMQGKQADGDGVQGTMNQDYRSQIKEAVLAADSNAAIIEPWDIVGALCSKIYPAGTPQSEMFKDDADVRRAFGTVVEAASAADVVISYLPEASMGSAVELHAAWASGRHILAVAPGSMASNWVVRSYSDHVFESIAELSKWLTAHLQQASSVAESGDQDDRPFVIRSMDDSDATSVLAIYQDGIDTGHATFQGTAPEWSDFDKAKLSSPRLVATSRQTGALLGWAVLSPVSSRPCYAGVAELSLYVSGAVRGQGVGSALLGAIVSASEANGIWMLLASLFPENVASERMHRRAGFTLLGRRRKIAKMEYGPLKGQWRDTLWMERRSTTVGVN